MPRWTPEARSRQAELVHEWKPWQHSTGARTAAGKKRSSQNARLRVGSVRYHVRRALELNRLLRRRSTVDRSLKRKLQSIAEAARQLDP